MRARRYAVCWGWALGDRVFEDNFLIADVRMTADFPTERWFWFEPHFKSGASALLDNYSDERVFGAGENIPNFTRATDFITPKTEASRRFRDAALTLAATLPFARRLVNSGRLSVPCTYDGSALNGPDCADLPTRNRPGAPVPDMTLP